MEDTYHCDRACIFEQGTEGATEHLHTTLIIEKIGTNKVLWDRTIEFDGALETEVIYLNDNGKTTDRYINVDCGITRII